MKVTLSHIGEDGLPRMVDVTPKEPTLREARASAFVKLSRETLEAVLGGRAPKGQVLPVVKVAAIQAAKATSSLIPLCHSLDITGVDVELRPVGLLEEGSACGIEILTKVRCIGRTGVEMESLTAAAIGALTVYDMCKALDRGIEIGPIRLLSKSGGRSDFRR